MHSLLQRVDLVRHSAQRIVWLHAWGYWLAAALAAALGASLVDYLLRPVDVVLRWLLTLAVLAVMGAGARRWLLPAWRYRPSLLEIAQRIELRWPQLGGRLSSSIEFLSQSESDSAGSVALRRRVIAEAEAASSDVEFGRSLNSRPQYHAFLAAGAMLLVIAACTAVSWQNVALGTARLAMPWSSLAWPRWNHLQFADVPERLARGDDLELVVIDQDQRLPESVLLQIEFDDGQSAREEMKFLDGRMVHRIDNVAQCFRYRAYGGDDDTMPWRRLEVVEPLMAQNVTLTVHPPPYAGAPWKAGGAVFTALAGSRLAIEGQTDRPLEAARVIREGGESIDLLVGADGVSFALPPDAATPWQPQTSGAYILQLTSTDGVTTDNAFRWDVRLVADAPPTVTIDTPSDGSYATPAARLPVVGAAKDDLALAAVHLRFLRPGKSDSEAEAIELWKAERNPLVSTGSNTSHRTTGGQTQSIGGHWDLQAVFGIQPGDVLSWFVEAADFSPQSGQTTAARLTIISSEEMQERLVQRQASALSQLAEALNLQRETRTQIESSEFQWKDVGQWRPRDRDLLHSAELHQRQVQTLAGRSATGAATILANILTDLEVNRLDLPEMTSRSREIVAVLDSLEAKGFPQAAAHFATLLRQARQEVQGGAATPQTLVALGRQQEEIAETLEQLLGKLSEWDSFQRIRRDLSQIRDDERALTSSTQTLQAEVVAVGEADAQQQADARRLARQQTELIRRFEKVQQRLAEFAQRSEADKAATAKAAEVAELAGTLAVTAKMRQAARSADELKLGQSLEAQQDVDRALQELLDALSGRTDSSSERALEQLRDLANSLSALEREQGKLAEEFEEKPGEQELQKLEGKQRELEQKTSNAARKAQESQAGAAANAAENAKQSMNQAAEAAKKKDANKAAEQAREAEQKLKEARQNVDEQLVERQTDLLREQMVRLEQHVQGLIVRQEAARHEAERLFKLKGEQADQLTEAQRASVADLSVEQDALAVEAEALGQGSQLPDAFTLQLQWTSGDMAAAASMLRALELGQPVLSTQRSALDRLRMVIEALKMDSSASNGEPGESPMGEPPPMPPPADDAPPPDIHDLAEVKLLRAMQAEVNRRTAELESQRSPEGVLPKPAEEQLAVLAREQGRVAELALKLVQSLGGPKRPKADNSSEGLPEVSDEELLRKLDEALLPGDGPARTENKP